MIFSVPSPQDNPNQVIIDDRLNIYDNSDNDDRPIWDSRPLEQDNSIKGGLFRPSKLWLSTFCMAVVVILFKNEALNFKPKQL